jgi:MFS family permease
MTDTAAAFKTEKIWNPVFISVFIANALMYLGQQMANTLVAKYADHLGANAIVVGMVIGIFALSALFLKIIAGPAIDSFNRKHILMIALAVMSVSFIGDGISSTVPMLFTFRILQGCGQAFTATCCLALAADALPSEKMGTGIATFSMAQAGCQAIGPTAGLAIYQHFGYQTAFFIAGAIMAMAIIAAAGIKNFVKPVKPFRLSLKGVIAFECLVPAVILFLLTGTYGAINAFLVIFSADMGVNNIGLFFTVYALTMLVSRPLIGRLSDKYGIIKALIPSILCFGLSFYLISISHNLTLFLVAGFTSAFGFGAAMPTVQTLCIKCVPSERRGLASTTAYIGNDLGNLVVPVLAGAIVEHAGYVAMWRCMIIPLLGGIAFLIVCRVSIQKVESEFKLRSAR